MKKIYLVFIVILFAGNLSAQRDNNSGVITAIDFHITRPLSEIVKDFPVDENKVYEKAESEDREHRRPQKFRFSVKDGYEYGNDSTVIQSKMGNIPGRAPITSWNGQNATGFRPMDPTGGAGPNHYVQMINSTTFKVYNKTSGANMLTASLGSLWSPATSNDGDPIVLYDKAADRWFLAQFGQTGNKMYIAISITGDPTGSYYTYTFTSPEFPDYLKFSVWSDGYYMTSNQTQKVFSFERAAMLAGNAGARAIYTGFSPPEGTGFFVPLPGDASDGTLPPAGTPCPIFSYSDNGWGAGYSDAVNIYQMSVNWVPATPTATITLAANLATTGFDASYNSSWNDVSQPSTTQKLDGIGGVCMYRSQWKSWNGYNTVVLNWGVKISTTQRSIKWCELRQNQSTNVWSIYQEGIYTPDAATRWMGSIAMDNNGSIGLCYMKSDATAIYPGLYYVGRRPCDPLGTLPITETQVIAGSGSQTTSNRVGDYAHLTLDPDGITFWHTSEYFAGTNTPRTQIFSFQIPLCGNTAAVSIVQTSGSNPQCPGASATFTATPVNGGASPSYQWQVNGSNVGSNSPTYTTSSLTNGQVITCIMTSNLAGVLGNPATSNAITMTVNPVVTPSVSIAITTGSNPTCAGSSVTFTATPVNGGSSPAYQWKVNGSNVGTNSATYTTNSLTNGQVVSCVMTSNASCLSVSTATSNGITMTITGAGAPSVSISQTSGTNPECAGSNATFTATVSNGNLPSYQWKVDGIDVGTNSSTFSSTTLTDGQDISCDIIASSLCSSDYSETLGTGTGTNATNSDVAAAYPTYYGNGRQQYLIRASEMTALGFSAGNITSLGFNVAGTVGDPATLNGYTIKIAQTSSTTTTTTFLTPTFTTVFGPVNYTPTINSLNTHIFSTPFNWNGTSNIVIDICFSNQVVGTIAYQNFFTTTSFFSTTYYQADGSGGAGACTRTTGTRASSRPNMTFNINSATLLNASSNVISMIVNSQVTPSVSIAVSSGTNPQCTGSSITFSATPTNGGASPSYQWKNGTTNVGTNSPTYTSSSLANGDVITCVLTSNANCLSLNPVTSNAITMTVNSYSAASVSISANPGNTICSGTNVAFTAIGVNGGPSPSYQWKIGTTNVGTNSPNYSNSSLSNGNSISCVMTSNAMCVTGSPATSNAIAMTVNPNVAASVSISANPGNTVCTGTNVTFTATPTNGGSTPIYQWKIGSTNVGTNSPTYSNASLANGNVITCVMTSNASCVSGSPATSNAIAMAVNPNLPASVSISANPGNTICAGANVTFTAIPTNGGTTPSYQWKIGITNVGTNSPSYSNASLANGNNVTCVMTSNSTCVTGSPATSNAITMTVNPNLATGVNISANPGSTICDGTNVSFSATPTNGGSTPSYQWKIGTTNVGTNSPNYSNASLANGNSISCVMTSNATCATGNPATSNAIAMTVNPNLATSVSISTNPGNTICDGTNVMFTATPTNGGTTPSYQWKIGTTNVGTNSPNYSNASLANGNSITCVMTSNASCATGSPATSNAIAMTVNPNLVAGVSISANPGNTICDGINVTFTASPTNGGLTPSYQWKMGTTNVGTNSPSYSNASLSNGDNISCEMISNATCSTGNIASSNLITMIVNSNLVASVNISANPGNTICDGTNVTFTASPTNGGATPFYQWKIGSTNVGTNSPAYSNASLSNGDNISCEIISNATCVTGSPATSNAIAMIVNPNLPASVSISANPGNTICEGTNVTFTATPTNGGATPSYQWKIGATNVGTNSPTYSNASLSNGDIISCEMISNETCVTGNPASSNDIAITVNPNLSTNVSISSNPGNTICDGATLTFTATPTNGGTTPVYQWKNGATNVGANDPVYSSNSFSDGDIITCEITSNALCVNGNTASSNPIALSVIPLPSISGFAPSSGIAGSSITISGSNFIGVTGLEINGTPVSSYIVDSPSQITMTIPNGASSGTISVVTTCGIANSSSSLTITSSTVELNLKFFIQGFYLSGGFMTEIVSAGITDTFTLELANASIPHTIDYTQTSLVSTNGMSTFTLPSSVQGKSYFIIIKHRNAIETWSSIPVDFFSNSVSYDFTTSDLKAYGNNEVALGDGNFALWSGDISDVNLGVGHQDGVIESQDYSDIENAVSITLIGYVVQDLTGDDIVESSDYGLMENNLFYTIVSIRP